MLDSQLFLGFPISSDFEAELEKVNPEFMSLFIDHDPHYLQKLSHSNQFFLGKTLGREIDLESIFLAEKNILSLLRKLVPSHSFDEISLILFPIQQPS